MYARTILLYHAISMPDKPHPSILCTPGQYGFNLNKNDIVSPAFPQPTRWSITLMWVSFPAYMNIITMHHMICTILITLPRKAIPMIAFHDYWMMIPQAIPLILFSPYIYWFMLVQRLANYNKQFSFTIVL